MAILAPRRIPNVIFGLTLFWGGVLSAFFWTSGFNFSFLIPWFCAIVVGVCIAHAQSKEYKKNILAGLKYRENLQLPVTDRAAFLNSERGVISTLGPIPFHIKALQRQESYKFEDLEDHAPDELMQADHFRHLLGKFLGEKARLKNPAHMALFDGLAMTMLHPTNLRVPAGIDRHNSRTLLTHSLLVFGLMAQRSSAYVYVPMYGVSPINYEFKIDPADPLIPILALAHDLGKIRNMVLDANGAATELLKGHSEQGARDLTQIVEFWAPQISFEDRRIIQSILAYSLRVADTPVQKIENEGKAIVTSDRLHALMGLLGECDRIAGSIEIGSTYSFAEPPKPVVSTAQVEIAIAPINLLNKLSQYFVMAMPVNARTPNKSVGFKRNDPAFTRGRHVVIIDEPEFITSFSKFLDQTDLDSRDGKSTALTKKVLEALDENGYLFRMEEEVNAPKRTATSCLYKIEFRSQGVKSEDTASLVLSSAFLVDVTDWPGMTKLQSYPNCMSTPTFAGFRLGRQPAKNIRRSANDCIVEDKLGLTSGQSIGQDLASLVTSCKPKQFQTEKIILKIGNALTGRQITIAATDDKSVAIVGADNFFRGIGLVIKNFETVPDTYAALGILQITTSLKNPEMHVVRLDKEPYKAFLKSLK